MEGTIGMKTLERLARNVKAGDILTVSDYTGHRPHSCRVQATADAMNVGPSWFTGETRYEIPIKPYRCGNSTSCYWRFQRSVTYYTNDRVTLERP